jgi:hypothetical protein
MTPFQQFRYWLRRAPTGERAGAGVALILVVALTAWLIVPADTSSVPVAAGGRASAAETGAAVGPTPSGPATSAGSGDPTSPSDASASGAVESSSGPATAPVDGVAGSAGSEQGPAATGCRSPAGSASGISADEVRIAVGLTDIAGAAANSLFGLPSANEQRAMFEAVIAGINREGGVACRRLVAAYHEANPADESQMHRVCLDVVDQGVFAMVDTGALSSRPTVLGCFGQHRVPFFTGYIITEGLRRQHFPYLYGFTTREQLYRDTAFALDGRGFFQRGNGFGKLGFLVKTCQASAIETFRTALAEVGVAGSQIVEYDIGCPSAFASPADLQQAVLTFQRSGVTHVLTGDIQGDLAVFTNIAQQQGFRPRYAFPDESVISLSYGSQRPNPENIDGAIAVTQSRQGEERTPGTTPSEGTNRCNAYYEAAGLPPVYEQQSIAGNTCSELWMLRDALGRAPELGAQGLPVGLQRVGSIDFSFPQGPNDFRAPGTTTGGQFWRVARFERACACWRVPDPDFHPTHR